jgi:hypothetical protein
MQLSNAAIKTLSVVVSFCLHAAGTAWLISNPHRSLARPKQAWNVTRLAFLPPNGVEPEARSHGPSSPTKVVDGTNRLGEDIDIDSVRIEILADDKKQMGGVLAKYGGLLGVADRDLPRFVTRAVYPATGERVDRALAVDDWVTVRIWEPTSWPTIAALGTGDSEIAYGLFPRSFQTALAAKIRTAAGDRRCQTVEQVTIEFSTEEPDGIRVHGLEGAGCLPVRGMTVPLL